MPAATNRPSAAQAQKQASAALKTVQQAQHYTPNAYEVMATRIANRVAEMAENITFVERQPQPSAPSVNGYSNGTANGNGATKRKPRKLEVRLPPGAEDVQFSGQFLDNTLSKMLELQNKMLKVGTELGKSKDVSDDVKKEQFSQAADLSRIIALICAEKARQGA